MRIVHPREGGVRQLDRQDFVDGWSRTLLAIAPALAPAEQAQQAGTSWITQVLLRYKRPLSSILATSMILQLTGLATPLLFQVIIDKVLVHRSESTLTVVCAALVTTALLEAIVQWLRGYSIAHTSARIDAQLGSKLFSHLLTLPLGYFDSRPAGQTVARVRELENIRTFLTSQGATSIIDALFSLIYLVVLGFYSIKLTVIVLLSLPAFFLFATFVARAAAGAGARQVQSRRGNAAAPDRKHPGLAHDQGDVDRADHLAALGRAAGRLCPGRDSCLHRRGARGGRHSAGEQALHGRRPLVSAPRRSWTMT